ncbi:MAG: DNA-processing protein DprA, partial [Brevibacterium aurantiacum]
PLPGCGACTLPVTVSEKGAGIMARLVEKMTGERQARMALSMIAEPNDPATGRVLNQVGGIETLRMIEDDQATVPGMNRADAIAWRERMQAGIAPGLARRVAQLQGGSIGTLIPSDAHWPVSLNDLGDRTPYLFWTRGSTSFLGGAVEDRVAISGARAASPYGTTVAAELAGELANQERVIVAGGSYGIEGAAHQAALAAGGSTVAVLASGLDRPYPAGHAEMLDRIGDLGLLVSEVPPGEVPTRYRFMARIRLLAALSGTTVIPEAGPRSMSLLVPTEARDLGRAVGAVPGPVTSAASAGTNGLIKRGVADVVTNAQEVTALLDKPEGPGRHRPDIGHQLDTPAPATSAPAGPHL